MGEKTGREIGIDLGTTNSVVSYIDDNGAIKFVKINNSILIPSCIFFKSAEDVFFGNKAKSYIKGMTQGTGISLFKKYLRADSEKFVIELADDKKVEDKYYLLDTNVFIDSPNILDTFLPNEHVILPVTVEQELEFRMSDVNTKYSAERALEQIVKHRDSIRFEESDLAILPDDFFKNFTENFNNANNDNKILSIALKLKSEGVILISSDNRLAKMKAKFVDVPAYTLKEFQLMHITKADTDKIEISGTEATARFLTYIRTKTEDFIGEPVTKAVITVPATFNLVEIENTKKAGLMAGFEEIHIEKEPTAAAIAYNIDANKSAKTFIYDFGGGTFDVSIIQSDTEGNFNVLATAGNPKLGGEDLTKAVEEYIYDYLEDNYDLVMFSQEESDLSKEQYAYNLNAIYWAAENCKIELSMSDSTTITLIDIYVGEDEQKSVMIDISRSKFEEIIKPTINRTIAEMNNGLSKADLFKEDVDNIILAGGTSLIPCIYNQVEHYFGRKPSADKNAATLISEGAAIIANSLWGENHMVKLPPKVYDITFEDFGVALEKWSYSCIIPHGTQLPASAEKTYSLVEDNQSQLNIKIFSRGSECQGALKTFDDGVEYLDELIMTNIPPMKIDEVDVVVKFEISKEYELITSVSLVKKDGTIVENGNLRIDRQSSMD